MYLLLSGALGYSLVASRFHYVKKVYDLKRLLYYQGLFFHVTTEKYSCTSSRLIGPRQCREIG